MKIDVERIIKQFPVIIVTFGVVIFGIVTETTFDDVTTAGMYMIAGFQL